MSSSQSKPRQHFTTRQRSILIAFYNKNPYPSASERYLLVQSTGRTIKQIQDWFSNRRRTDDRLISTATINNIPLSLSRPRPMPMPSVYYSSISSCPMCSYCSQLQSSSIDNYSCCYSNLVYYYPSFE